MRVAFVMDELVVHSVDRNKLAGAILVAKQVRELLFEIKAELGHVAFGHHLELGLHLFVEAALHMQLESVFVFALLFAHIAVVSKFSKRP